MTLREKRQQEQNEIKARRVNAILDTAFNLFSENGIEVIAMTDIAKAAEIGVASLYRYFQTKEELAIQCAEHTWLELSKSFGVVFISDEYKNKTGIEQMRAILEFFTEMFDSFGDFFRFIYHFDSFIHKSGVPASELDQYESDIGDTKKIVVAAIQKGISDGTINKALAEKEGIDMIYYTVMHSMFSMAQKLALSGKMLSESGKFAGVEQIRLLSRLLLDSISAK